MNEGKMKNKTMTLFNDENCCKFEIGYTKINAGQRSGTPS